MREGKMMSTENTDAIELRFVSDGPMVQLSERRVKKDIIRTGDWTFKAPILDPKTGEVVRVELRKLHVPESRVDHWVREGNAMLASGVRVPMPLDHDEDHSERNQGFVTRFYKEADPKRPGEHVLYCEAEIPDEPKTQSIGRTIREVSADIRTEFIDDAGRVWRDVIRHVAPCIVPKMHAQENFIQLKQVTEPFSGGMDMDELIALLRENAALAEAAGVDLSDLSAENALAKLKALLAFTATGKAEGEAAQAKLKDVEASVTALAAERDALKGEVVQLKSQYEPPADEPSPEVIRLREENAQLRSREIDVEVDALLKDGKIAAAKRGLVVALLASPESEVIRLKDVAKVDGKDVATETSLAVAEGVRTLLKSLPPGAAFATGKLPAGSKEAPLPKEPGDDPERKALAKLASEIQLKDRCTYAEALIRAEATLRT